MKSMTCSAMVAVPLVFAVACVGPLGDNSADESTSTAGSFIPPCGASAPNPGPTSPPRRCGVAMESQAASGASDGTARSHLVGFDADAARANGYEIVALPNGAQASVPVDKAEAARTGEFVPTEGVLRPPNPGGASPQDHDSIPGDCGSSFVALWAMGNSRADLDTGFELIPSAGAVWDLHWSVGISDNGGKSVQHYDEGDGYNVGTTWTASRILSLTRGMAYAAVIGYSSFTITTHGWVCYSYGPATSEEIR